jgi:TrmH family RNA methyltransferase
MGRGKVARPHDLRVDLDVIQQLQTSREFRDSSGLFWAEGLKPFFSTHRAGHKPHTVVVCRDLLTNRQAEYEATKGQRVLHLSTDQFLSISHTPEPQGIGIVAEQSWGRMIDISPSQRDIWLVLENTRTPGNLGTMLRTNAAAGVKGVMLLGGEADPHEPGAVRASMGAIFEQCLVRTSLKALQGWLGRRRCTVVGTSSIGAIHYRRADYSGPLLLMLGSERHGLGPRALSLCNQVVRVPMSGAVDSLNLAVAAGIVLYEAVEQRSDVIL